MKLYLKYFSIHFKSSMQYKSSFLLIMIGQFLVSFNVFLGVYFMFSRFNQVAGFSYHEVLLCFSIVLMEFSLAETFARGFDSFSTIIGNGEFDRIMVRPRNEIMQVLGSRIELTRIGRMLQAIIVFIYAIIQNDIHWTPLKILTLVLMMVGGMWCLYRDFYYICCPLFFYNRRAGIYECFNRRGKGIWQIPSKCLWEKGAAILHLYCTFCLNTILSTPLSIGQGGTSRNPCLSLVSRSFSHPLYTFLEIWHCPL